MTDQASSLCTPPAGVEASDMQASTNAADCQSMDDVRFEIDRLDRVLVALLAERQQYIEAAGRIKGRRSDVRVPWRIEDVVAKVMATADRMGLSKKIAEPVWRELIERCIDHEDEIWRQKHGAEPIKSSV